MKTKQSEAWAGEFGNEYTARNMPDAKTREILSRFWAKALLKIDGWPYCDESVKRVLEVGAGSGANLEAMAVHLECAKMVGADINPEAYKALIQNRLVETALHCNFLDVELEDFDLVVCRGVLIHIEAGQLAKAYARLYNASNRYIILAEYYSRTPQEIIYRGQAGLCWKRDFAGEMMNLYPDLKLLDYGFEYHRDPVNPQDDVTWFLLEKPQA